VRYLLDTHVWVWWHVRPARLSARAAGLIGRLDERDELLLSAISVWEFAKLVEKGRLGLNCDPEEWIDEALRMPKLRLVPLSPLIAYRSTILPGPFHDDPADQIIVATAREEDAAILTKDKKLLRYRHVRAIW